MSTPFIEYVPGADEMAPDVPGLKAPYKFRMSIQEFTELRKDYLALARANSKAPNGDKTRMFLQYLPSFDAKPIKYGVRLHLWLLAMKLEDFGPDRGCTEVEWQALTGPLVELLKTRLPGCNPYVEGWKDRKPQFRFDTYIRYTEHDE